MVMWSSSWKVDPHLHQDLSTDQSSIWFVTCFVAESNWLNWSQSRHTSLLSWPGAHVNYSSQRIVVLNVAVIGHYSSSKRNCVKFLLSISSVNISNGIGSTQFPVLNFFPVKATRQVSFLPNHIKRCGASEPRDINKLPCLSLRGPRQILYTY